MQVPAEMEMAEFIAKAVISHPGFVYIGPLTQAAYSDTLVYTPPSDFSVFLYIQDLILRDPVLFLMNYGKFLSPEEIRLVAESREDLEIKVLADSVGNEKRQKGRKRNRRFVRLQQLIQEGDFFSEDAIFQRDPGLYTELVGKYRDCEGKAEFPASLSEAILALSDRTERLRQMPSTKESIAPEDLADNEDFLIRTMHERFLFTEDPVVDADSALDDLEVIDRDAEMKWFDTDEPDAQMCTDTGTQDF